MALVAVLAASELGFKRSLTCVCPVTLDDETCPWILRPVEIVPSSPPREIDLCLLLDRVPRFWVDAGLPMALFLVGAVRPVIVL